MKKSILLSSHSAGAIIHYGFADAVYEDLVFEFKRVLDSASQTKGESKLAKYLLALSDPEHRFGLLTDGERVRAYILRDGNLIFLENFLLNETQADDAIISRRIKICPLPLRTIINC